MTPLKIYEFNYSIDGVMTELPLYLRVRARNKRQASSRAREKLKVECRYWGRPYWKTTDGVTKKVPRQIMTGKLYEPGSVVKRRRKRIVPMDHQINPLFTEAMSKTILDIIDNAPLFSSLFSVQPMQVDSGLSIPMSMISYLKPTT